MKIEWLIDDESSVGSPARVERDIFLVSFWMFFGQLRPRLWLGATLRCRNPLLSPSNFTQVHLRKLEWLVTDVTAVGSPDRAERGILGDGFGPFLANSGHFCGRGASL